MEEITPEDVESGITDEDRKRALEKFESREDISWIHKQNPAWREIYVAIHWLEERLKVFGCDEGEMAYRLLSAVRKAVKVGPYVAVANAWNEFMNGEMDQLSQRMMAARATMDKALAKVINAGAPVN